MKVNQLLELLLTAPKDAEIVVQMNEPGEEDIDTDESTYTFAIGEVFSVFQRDHEVVIDCAVTDRE